jgi:Peptidase family M23/Bacterial Ig-like domain (group 2)
VNITVTPSELTLSVGETALLVAAVRDAQGLALTSPEVRWSSNAPDIVAVSATGIVTALREGTASVGAYAQQSVEFARVVVQADFRLPLRRWRVVTQAGGLAPGCPAGEGGLRVDSTYDCSHAGISRYSLDLVSAIDEQPSPNLPDVREVRASADGTIIDICLQPLPGITCGANGPYILVEHQGGFLTLYAHLDPSSVSLRRKTAVTQGQPLGVMGSFAADTIPWLHFEMRRQGGGANEESVLSRVELGGRTFSEYSVNSSSE